MKLTPKIQKAINKAAELHLGQVRKGGNLPYIVHPYTVAFLAADFTNNEDIIAACLLHDVLEDVVGYDYEKLRLDFGENVARLVKSVSEDKDASIAKEEELRTWCDRKIKYIENLANHDSDSLLVSCADKIQNLQSLINLYMEKPDERKNFWSVFNAPEPKNENSLWFYGEILKIMQERLDNGIVKEFEKVFLNAKEVFSVS